MIRRDITVLALVLSATTWAANAPDAKTVLADASKALGADGLKSVEFSGSGFDYTLGQNPTPSSPWPKFNDKTYARYINFDNPESRMARIRTQFENPPRGGGQQPIVGEQQQNQVIAPGSPAAATIWDDLMMSVPYGFVRAASAAKDVKVGSKSMGGKKYTTVTFTAANKAPATGYFNADHVLERVETKIDNNVLGDISFVTTYADYKSFGTLKFPAHIVQAQGGFPVLDLTISDVKMNTAPTVAGAAGGRGGAGGGNAPASTPTEKLSDGVYLILGGYAALALDYGDHILIIEGPQSDQRAEEVMATAKQLIPGKPIKYVVNTHAHFDHSGGLRDFVAEGVTIITHEVNKPYYQKIWSNPHTLAPDRLSKSPKKAVFKTVGEQMELTGNGHTVMLYHMQDFLHHNGMLLAYLPKEKILVEADGFNPPARAVTQASATISPYNLSLLANIDRLKLSVDRIIPIHLPADNRKITVAEVMKAVGK